MVRISTQEVNNPKGLGAFIEVDDAVAQPDGSVAFPYPPGQTDTFLSQRDGAGVFQAMPGPGTNEKFTIDGSTVTGCIPEGRWTYAIVQGVRQF